MRILTEQDLKECVTIGLEEMQTIEEGFTQLSRGLVEMPPIQRMDMREHNGEIDIKSAYVKGCDNFTVKMSTGFFNNPKLGLPSGSGMISLFNSTTGVPEAVMLDNGYLTDIRTGLAGGIAAKYLSRVNAETVGIIGTGKQAKFQLRALKLIRNIKNILVHGLDQSLAEAYLEEMCQKLALNGKFESSPERLVTQCDIVITSTPSRKPIVRKEWLSPGQHLTAMGADAEFKQELDENIFSRADLIACDSKSQCFRLGELHHAMEKGILSLNDPITELGEIISGTKKGRTSPDQISVCDLTGTGVQDTVIATLAYKKAAEKGLGLEMTPLVAAL